jgi:hypothetical protein
LVSIVYFESNPPSPPSASAQLKRKQQKQHIPSDKQWDSIKGQIKLGLSPFISFNFWLLMHGLGTIQG